MKKIFSAFIFILCLLSIGQYAMAQVKPKPVKKPVEKNTHVGTKTFLGKYTGQTVTLQAEEAKVAIDQPLTVTDNSGNKYEISSYQFSYSRIGATEDEATGKVMQQRSMVSERFTTNPLPDTWKNVIKEELQSTEELYFFDVIAIDKTGRRFFAPDLKIIIQ